jgi:hypothetical protein
MTNPVQMSKKMGFSVIGLPHYTIWHEYEPSVDDIQHMEVSTLFLVTVLHRDLTRDSK